MGDPIEIHPAVGGERYALSKQLSPLLVRTFGKIREAAILSDHAVRQPLMTAVCRAAQQGANRLIQVGSTVSPQRYPGVSRYAPAGTRCASVVTSCFQSIP